MVIQAVLFDMDGVLIDARDWHYEALNEALEHFGYTITRDSHLSTFDGLPTSVKLEMLSQSQNLPRSLHELINKIKQKYTIIHSYTKCKPTFNHRQCLSRLKRDGYKIAVCSNSIKPSIDTMLSLAGLRSYVDVIFSNQDVTQSKPHPEMYLNAMRYFSLGPKECLIIEDSEHGIQAAKASEAYCLEVSSPSDVTYDRLIRTIKAIEAE